MNFNKYKNLLKQNDIILSKFPFKKNLKKLIIKKKKSLGRSQGTITVWHRGGGVKNNLRLLSNYRSNGKYGIIWNIEHDPNRSAYIGTIQYNTGAFSKVLISSRTSSYQFLKIHKYSNIFYKEGDSIKLKNIPLGTSIFNIEKFPGSGPIYSKAAGVSSYLIGKTKFHGLIKLPSKEEKLFDLNCSVTLGNSSNIHNKLNKKYKAGTNRLLNKRPIVRGVAMNPIDHPHGGGAGKGTPGRPSVSPWGQLSKRFPTRKKNNFNKFILKRRK